MKSWTCSTTCFFFLSQALRSCRNIGEDRSEMLWSPSATHAHIISHNVCARVLYSVLYVQIHRHECTRSGERISPTGNLVLFFRKWGENNLRSKWIQSSCKYFSLVQYLYILKRNPTDRFNNFYYHFRFFLLHLCNTLVRFGGAFI